MPHVQEWHVVAIFDTKEQAKQAAYTLEAMQPREYTFTVIEDGMQVWQEKGLRYGARDVRV